MKRLLIFVCMLAATVYSAAAENIPMDQFVAMARRRNTVATYAKLSGMLQHRRRGQDAIAMHVYFGAIIHPDRTVGQLLLDGKEGYLLSQAQGSGLTSVRPMAGSASDDKLGYVGVRASDLMMSFLFCEVEKEFESELLRGMVHCRVFLLDDKENKEKIKIWISSEHIFPMKAEFYRYGETEHFRELEAGALSKKGDVYYVRRIRVEGPGWVTKIDFDSDTADVGMLDTSNPPDIIVRLDK